MTTKLSKEEQKKILDTNFYFRQYVRKKGYTEYKALYSELLNLVFMVVKDVKDEGKETEQDNSFIIFQDGITFTIQDLKGLTGAGDEIVKCAYQAKKVFGDEVKIME